MKKITVDTSKGKKRVPVYKLPEDVGVLDRYSYVKTVNHGKEKYINIACAFDIETTNIKAERPYAFMYQWQFCLDTAVFMGRTWDEFLTLLGEMHTRLNLGARKLVVYVHNLPFEFQFIRQFVSVTNVFLKNNRQPLRALINGVFEFRDSYALSNMSLEKFCENTPDVVFMKNDGEAYDYKKRRYPWTKLSRQELSYCYCDVAGLCECIRYLMKSDDLAHIPLTSTGYVRRDFRNEYRKNPKLREIWQERRLTPETYRICREAFRGGDTHANYMLSGMVLENVTSYDISSSYPAAMLLDRFPVGQFTEVPAAVWVKHNRMPDFAALIHVRFLDLEYIGTAGMPYIPLAKCRCSADRINDNGRLLKASGCDMWLTDIDLEIIEHDYSYSGKYVDRVFVARYGELPEEHKKQLMHYFRLKTELKGIAGKEYEYMKSKNRLNSGYGMMVTDIAKPEWEYYAGDYHLKPVDLAEQLDKFYKSRNNFLRYEQGLWVTANARRRLREMIWKVGADVVYVDTDSIKFRKDHAAEFEAQNAEIIKRCEAAGYYAEDRKGKRHYLGTWDFDGSYAEFKTLGSKRYIVREAGSETYKTTIAGVRKKAGAEYFTKHGIDAFRDGCVIKNAGHTVAYYNDDPLHTIRIGGGTIRTGSNVALLDEAYTLGLTGEYMDLLMKAVDKRTTFI